MARLRRPATLEDAIGMLGDGPSGAVVPIAGGVGISLAMALGGSPPTDLVAIGHLPELRTVERDGADVVLGAGLTLGELSRGGPVGVPPLLARAAADVANPGIREVGTLVGNLIASGPASDVLAALLALDATLEVVGRDGVVTRTPLDAAPAAGSIVRGVRVPLAVDGWGWQRLTIRGAMDRSCATVAATVTGRSRRVALTVAPVRPTRLPAVETAGPWAIRDAATADLSTVVLRPDDRVSDAYRRRVIPVMVERAVGAAAG